MTDKPSKMRILFLCTGNSCRSQMAEGWTRHFKSEWMQPYSAGIKAVGVNPRAVAVMQERGVDISHQQSKTVADLTAIDFDCVVTVCSHADHHCPTFKPGVRVVHVAFDDPPTLAIGARDEEEALDHFRRVRDEIRDFVAGLPEG